MSSPPVLFRTAYHFQGPCRAVGEGPAAYELRLRAHCRRLRADLERAGAYRVTFSPDRAEGPVVEGRRAVGRCFVVSPAPIAPLSEDPGAGVMLETFSIDTVFWRLFRSGPLEHAEGPLRAGAFVWGESFPLCLCQEGCRCGGRYTGGRCACAGVEGCLCDGLLASGEFNPCWGWICRNGIFGYGRSAGSWPGDSEAADARCEPSM